MAAEQSQNTPVFESANIKNIETLAALAATYVRSLIGASDPECQWVGESCVATPERPFSLDEEVKQLRAEQDYVDAQLNQYQQCTEILRRALESTERITFKHEWRRREIGWEYASIMATCTSKLPKLPGEVLSKICEQYRHMVMGRWGVIEKKTTNRELCDIICTGKHVPLKVQVGTMSPQLFRDSILLDVMSPLDVFTSDAFSIPESRHKGNRTLRTLKNAIELGERWRTLCVEENDMDAVDFVLQRCQSVLPLVRILDISGKFVEGSMQRESWPILVPMGSRIPCMRVAKAPLGYVASSKWLFQHLSGLCVRLPDKLDKPEDLVECLQNWAGLKRLTLRASSNFHLESYQTEKVASIPSLEELELMFDELDMDILTCMLGSFSCRNVRKYIAHFDPLFGDYVASQELRTGEDRNSDDLRERQEKESHDFAVNLWSFLDEQFPALEDITLTTYHVRQRRGGKSYSRLRGFPSWDIDFMSLLIQPLDSDARWLFPRLSSLAFRASHREEQRQQCNTILQLAVARAQQENVSDMHSVTIYGIYGFSSVNVELDFDVLQFHIPNLHIEWTNERSRWTEGWLFT
ncbi:hypothetical protein BD410DRAFT_841144 [Rickenella mellea]|uniref:Uncharacterized protein n=1 Tax=Rickenella mellea TaxID=50990 RepID=A0A4Y7PZY3_9AGAM|nr:hypothetical protein BD410DRAFT_841144 [Rickenella mellea]